MTSSPSLTDEETTKIVPLVLIVDDDTSVSRALIRRLVISCTVNCVTAVDGFAAFQLLCARRFALVVADMAMAGMSGAHLLWLAKENWPEMRRILFTGYADAGIVLTDNSADAILAKGGDIASICETICQMASTPRAKAELSAASGSSG